MTSRDKIAAFKHAMLAGDDVFDGLLGAVQGLIGAIELSGRDVLDELPETAAEIDDKLLEVAAFVLWLRSDDAATPDPRELIELGPKMIGELVGELGIGG